MSPRSASARLAGLAAAAGLLLACGPALAHHSTAMFEWGTDTTIHGTIETVEWTQPHVWMTMMVPDGKGGADRWEIEGMSPSYLNRNGWSKRTLNPGDKITMIVYRLKDGRKGGFCAEVDWPDGRKLRHVPSRADPNIARNGN
jgi:hypothetical protein